MAGLLKTCQVIAKTKPMTILAVTGLTKEAEIVGVADVVAVAGGGDAVSLAEKLNALHGDIRGVISIGLAGALSPHLKVGDVVIADQIITGAEDLGLRRYLAGAAGCRACRMPIRASCSAAT